MNDETTHMYMLFRDIKSFMLPLDDVDSMVAELSEDGFCVATDIFGDKHNIYYSDIIALNNIRYNIEDMDLFTKIISSWAKLRN